MKKVKVNLTGGVLGPQDSIEYDGHEMPGIYRVEISADVHAAPMLNIFMFAADTCIDFEPSQVIIHELTLNGATRTDYKTLLKERDALRERCNEIERLLIKTIDNSLDQKKAFLKLPMSERRKILQEQAEELLPHYKDLSVNANSD